MRKFFVAAIVTTLSFLSIPASLAHGEIVATFPEQYSNVTPIPTQLWIEFDGNLQTLDGQTINTIEVLDSTGLTISFGDPIIEGGKISTKMSGQAAAGVFTVNYRIVSEDGHPVEGSYTFNASPEYAEAVPTTTSVLEKNSSFNFGGFAVIVIAVLLGIAVLVKRRSSRK